VQAQMQALYSQMSQQLAAVQHNAVPSAPRAELPRIRQPSSFAGTMGFAVDDWIGEMLQQFAYYGARFPDGASQVRFAVAFLSGPALHWWEHEADRATLADWSEFVRRLHARFRPVQAAMLARQKLGKLSQRAGQSVNQYTSAFQITLTPITDMGDADQVHHYVNGLLGVVAAKVWERHPTTLKEAIDFAVSVEAMSNYGRAALPSGHRSSSYAGGASHHTSAPMEVNHMLGDPEEKYDEPPAERDPMAIILAKMESMEHRLNALNHSGGSPYSSSSASYNPDRSKILGLKPGDLARLRKEGRCFRCKSKDHMKNECPQRPKNE
jgi:hypothetical protein